MNTEIHSAFNNALLADADKTKVIQDGGGTDRQGLLCRATNG
jgi:hypothetical protein